MDRFPPELHSYICSLACTDDGLTIRSLTLVSKYFAQVTLPFLYQSVSASGPSQIASLAHRLQKTPPHHRAIHHLYLSDSTSSNSNESKPLDRSVTQSILHIIALAAPTLETLTFVASSPTTSTSLIAGLFRLKYPHLYELTISGHYPFPSIPGSFPSLERLHLLGNKNPYGLFGALESCTPALTHLAISGLNLAVSFSQELRQAFEDDENNDDGEYVFPAKLPTRLRHVLVRCGPERSTLSASAQLKDRKMVQNFEMLEGWVGRVGHITKFSVLPRAVVDILPDDIRKGCVERLRGAQGCWECV